MMNFVFCSQLYYVDVSIESHSHSYSVSHIFILPNGPVVLASE